MALSFASIVHFFSGETKLIERAENALQSNHLLSFTYDGTVGLISATVKPSMKKGTYCVKVRRNCDVSRVQLRYLNILSLSVNAFHSSLLNLLTLSGLFTLRLSVCTHDRLPKTLNELLY